MKAYRIAIVGLGPKGLYAFERLLAQLGKLEIDKNIEVHLFEKSGNFGAGEIYDPVQPSYLLMNYPNRNINVWPSEILKPVVDNRLSFAEWIAKGTYSKDSNLNDHFASRSMVGYYLTECFEKLYRVGISSYRIVKHRSSVVSIIKKAGVYELGYLDELDAKDQFLTVNNILISTGHCSWKGQLQEKEKPESTSETRKSFIPFIYPVDSKLSPIQSNTQVAIKGMGLTFIDALLALTEGRGGRFIKKDDESYIYEPSKREPGKIYGFCRTGLPMIPRSTGEGKKPYLPVFFTLRSIYGRIVPGDKPSFLKNILPLYILETEYNFYKVAFHKRGLNLDPDDDVDRFRCQILKFHKDYPNEQTFNFRSIFKPVDFQNPTDNLGPLAYLRYVMSEAELGSEKSPFMAAVLTWGNISEQFSAIYNFGGMTAESHRFFDLNYRSQLNRISYGPPLTNMKKILALIENGILNLDYSKNPVVKRKNNKWTLKVPNRVPVNAEVLVDARIPTNTSKDNWSELLIGLQNNELLREFIVPGKESYNTGCPEVDRSGRLIDYKGNINPDITLYGTLTEGITYDNDSLSRTKNNFASDWALRTARSYSNIGLNSNIKTLR